MHRATRLRVLCTGERAKSAPIDESLDSIEESLDDLGKHTRMLLLLLTCCRLADEPEEYHQQHQNPADLLPRVRAVSTVSACRVCAACVQSVCSV